MKISLLKNKVQEILKWEKPSALPSRRFPNKPGEYTWEDWEEEMKSKHPYKYFLFETVPDHASYIFNKIDRKIYWLQSVTYKKQHLLDLRQPKNRGGFLEYRYGYCDPRQKFIYAVFAILQLYMDEMGGEKGLRKYIKWYEENHGEESERFINDLKGILGIYVWWQQELPIKVKQLDKNYSFEFEDEIENEINEKIKQLTDYRVFLWT